MIDLFKIRVWNKDEGYKKMFYLQHQEISMLSHWLKFPDTYTVMLPIGLNDKNGNPIYVGDIVEVAHGYEKADHDPNHDDVSYPVPLGKEKYVVTETTCWWSKIFYGPFHFRPLMTRKEYLKKVNRNNYKPFWELSNMWFIEVVGNRFDNSELLNSLIP